MLRWIDLQVIVVNYEDKHTTMEAPDDQDEISYRCASWPHTAGASFVDAMVLAKR